MTDADTTRSIEPTSLGLDNRKLGIWTLLGSEAVFFSSLIITYVIFRGQSVKGPYPHQILNATLTGVNTLILICSSLTMVSTLAAIQHGEKTKLTRLLLATMGLGLLFLAGQTVEFTLLARQGLSLKSNLFGSTFFTLTGFHGAHVAAGIIWIGFLVARAAKGKIEPENPITVELAGLYWHFVDLVWILIFTIVYLI